MKYVKVCMFAVPWLLINLTLWNGDAFVCDNREAWITNLRIDFAWHLWIHAEILNWKELLFIWDMVSHVLMLKRSAIRLYELLTKPLMTIPKTAKNIILCTICTYIQRVTKSWKMDTLILSFHTLWNNK